MGIRSRAAWLSLFAVAGLLSSAPRARAQPYSPGVFVRIAGIGVGQDGASYGTRHGVSVEGVLDVRSGRRLRVVGSTGLVFAEHRQRPDLVTTYEGRYVRVEDVRVAPLANARIGALWQTRAGGGLVALGPEVGLVMKVRDGSSVRPSGTVLLEGGVKRFRGFVRIGLMGMPVAWRTPERVTVRTRTEVWRSVEVGVSIRVGGEG